MIHLERRQRHLNFKKVVVMVVDIFLHLYTTFTYYFVLKTKGKDDYIDYRSHGSQVFFISEAEPLITDFREKSLDSLDI